jgi:hypothetical protein
MEYRDLDYNKDIDEVVSLIQNNLRPTYSREILEWKHLHNPFGPSYSIVAIEDGKIVAVAFYMRYNYRNDKGDIIKCLRPFDACTDINHRGKGIFKTLMTKILEKYKDDYDFLLANPNSNSYPEFLKLGWEEPKMEYYYIGLVSPFISNYNNISKVNLVEEKKELNVNENFFLAGNSMEFLKWRYALENYKIVKDKKNGKYQYLVYRIERKNKLKAIIVCDYYGDTIDMNDIIKGVCKMEKIYIIYFLKNQITKNIKTLMNIKHKKAIKVFKTNNFQLPSNLVISLGDMEGRL